jgi:DNA-binding NarL/FixJ family response regulator
MSLVEELLVEVVAASTPDTLKNSLESSWSIILLDLTMPELAPISTIWQIAEAQPGSDIMIYSGGPPERIHAMAEIANENGLKVRATISKRQGFGELQRHLEELFDAKPLGD